MTRNLTAVEDSLATDEGKRMFATLQGHLKAYREARAGVIELSDAGRRDAAYALNQRTVVPAASAAAKEFADLFESKVKVASAENDAIEAAAASSRKRSLLLLGAALLIGFAMAFWFARRIQQTVAQILSRIETLRERDTTDLRNAITGIAEQTNLLALNAAIEAARVGEIAAAVEEITHEAARAESAVTDVASVAEESSASAEQVSASTQQTSASAQEIAASAQTLSGTAEQLNALVRRFKVAA